MIKNKYFVKNLSILIGIILLFFLISVYYTNNNSRKILENELLSSDKNYIEIINNSMNSVLKDIRFIIATLDIDHISQTFFYSKEPEKVIPDIYVRLQEKLIGYVNGYSCIHSIYLYSGHNDTVITSLGKYTTSNFSIKCPKSGSCIQANPTKNKPKSP